MDNYNDNKDTTSRAFSPPDEGFTIAGINSIEGFIEISAGVRYGTIRKPHFIHLFFMRLLLGWRWIDA